VERGARAGLRDTQGWWNSVSVADVDGDRRPDLVLGNLGLNSYITASRSEPARLYVSDFGRDGTVESILTVYKNGVSYPVAGRDELIRAIPALRDRYPSYAAFGASTIDQILPAADIAKAKVLEARGFASVVARNDGKGRFTVEPLPDEAQIAPVHATVADDFDGDGRIDLLVGGNFHGVPPIQGRYDASYGLLLRGTGGGRFAAVAMPRSGVELEGQVRRMRIVRTPEGRVVVVARNDDSVLVLRPTAGAAANPLASGPSRPRSQTRGAPP